MKNSEVIINHPVNGTVMKFKNINEFHKSLNDKHSYGYVKKHGLQKTWMIENGYRTKVKLNDGRYAYFKFKKDIIELVDIPDKLAGKCDEIFNDFIRKNDLLIRPFNEPGLYIFKNENEAFEFLNITQKGFTKRMDKTGDSFEKTFWYYENKLKNKKKIKLTHPTTGEELFFNTKIEIIKYLDVEKTAFLKYANKYGLQEAFDFYTSKKKESSIFIFGKSYNQVSEIYETLNPNMHVSTFRKKFNNLKEIMKDEDAIILIMMENGFICVDKNTGEFEKISDVAKDLRISENLIISKMKEGFTYGEIKSSI